ncbi:MAG TPA: hypothetical protein VGB83_10395 [Actinomycetota bacterium]
MLRKTLPLLLVAAMLPIPGEPVRAAGVSASSPSIVTRWQPRHSAGAGDYVTENRRGARAKFRFRGDSVVWLTRKGPRQGKAWVYVDGDRIRSVNNYAEANDDKVWRRFKGFGSGTHRLRVKVRGKRSALSTGTWIAVQGFRANGRVFAPSAATYRWAEERVGGTRVVVSSARGATATYRFSGKGIDWRGPRGPGYGKAQVYVDGVLRETVDAYAAAESIATLSSVAGLARGKHTLRIRVLGTHRDAASGSKVGIARLLVPRPPKIAFRKLGAWIDLYDTDYTAAARIQTLVDHDVRTLYIQTGRYDRNGLVNNAAWIDGWLKEAHDRGIRVVGWYLPAYDQFLDRDVRRTVQVFKYVSADGERFDAVAVDIEYRGETETRKEFNTGIVKHLRRVRAKVGNKYPVGGITPAPLGMALAPDYWKGFPWGQIGRYSDVVLPMSYWSYRRSSGQCPDDPLYCEYRYTIENTKRAGSRTGLPVHVIGGVANVVTNAQVGRFVDGALTTDAIGGSIYDYKTTKAKFWAHLERLNKL